MCRDAAHSERLCNGDVTHVTQTLIHARVSSSSAMSVDHASLRQTLRMKQWPQTFSSPHAGSGVPSSICVSTRTRRRPFHKQGIKRQLHGLTVLHLVGAGHAAGLVIDEREAFRVFVDAIEAAGEGPIVSITAFGLHLHCAHAP